MSTLILDTNILLQEGFYSRNMQLLMRLSLAGHVEIHIPDLVKREFITRRVSESVEKAQEAYNNFTFISKKLKNDSHLRTTITDIQKTCRAIELEIQGEVENEFNTWVASYKINILPFDSGCMDTVLDEYFSGIGVFRKLKSREDIPDAIINASIMALQTAKETPITVILKDGAFKKHLSKVDDIYVLDSIKEFIDKIENSTKLDELDALFDKIDSIKTYLSSKEFSEAILTSLVTTKNEIEDIYIEEGEISSLNNLDANSFGESINYPKAETINDFIISNVAWLTEGLFSLEVEFTTTATIDYCTDYGSYLTIIEDIDREIQIDSMNGDGICDITEVRDVKFTGYIQLYIDGDLSNEEIKGQRHNIGAAGSPLQLNIEIEYAEIL